MITSTSNGSNSGLTFDTLDVKTSGPYTLTFRLQSQASGDGELYWTTNAKNSLPKGHNTSLRSLTMANGMRCRSSSIDQKGCKPFALLPAVALANCSSNLSACGTQTAPL